MILVVIALFNFLIVQIIGIFCISTKFSMPFFFKVFYETNASIILTQNIEGGRWITQKYYRNITVDRSPRLL